MSKKIIFAHEGATDLAKTIAGLADAEMRNLSWEKFKDGWPKLFINQANEIKNRDVVFVANFAKPETLFEQFAIIYSLPRHFVRSFRVIIPFYPVGTMERVDTYGDIATAETLARMISSTPMTQTGPVIFSIFDIHALQGQFYFSEKILPELVSAIPLLKERIKSIKNLAIVFPDDGAYKRFGKMFPEYPHIICNKIRMSDGNKTVTIKEGDAKGKHVIIVDDLVQTGGTLLECREVLLRSGSKEVSAFVTHGVFPKDSWKNFLPDLFSHIWITDSCPDTVKKITTTKEFEILSLAPCIAEIIKD